VITNVAVVGAGIMGHGFAQIFATHGRTVRLADVSREAAERGKQAVVADLRLAVEAGGLPPEDVPAILERIEPVGDLAAAVAGADFVLEAVSEDQEVKEAVWRALPAAAGPAAILATNTSSYDINWFAGLVDEPARVIGTHWFNPPHIVPCVEVVPGDATGQAVVDRVVSLLEDLGKEPSLCRSVPGFVGNRIQFAMIAEAFRCLEEGVATPEAIDRIVRGSFGLRLGLYGPFEIGDLNGLDTYQAVFDYLEERYEADRFTAPDTLKALCGKGDFGLKTGRGIYTYSAEEAAAMRESRDRRLYAQLRAVRDGAAQAPGEERK
jgi:3-hydroxybutyryl-CoA dehydrogenase